MDGSYSHKLYDDGSVPIGTGKGEEDCGTRNDQAGGSGHTGTAQAHELRRLRRQMGVLQDECLDGREQAHCRRL